MQITFRYGFLLISLAVFCAASQTFAQNTSVIGRITDAETQAPLVGVNIILSGTTFGSSTDAAGRFQITGVPAGEYEIVVSNIGYRRENRKIQLEANITTEVNFELVSAPIDLGSVLVEGDRSFSTASAQSIRNFDLLTRPNRSAQDMLQLAPGLIIAQHAGGGKAEQIFLRGFDADHGTDVAIFADGIPVNMVSHGGNPRNVRFGIAYSF